MSETLYTDIRAALTQHLNTMPDRPAVAWENDTYTPAVDVPYFEPSIIWGETFQAEYGTNGANRIVGLYQIICHYPTGGGSGDLNDMLGKLRERFKRGTTLTYNGLTVKIRKAYPSANNVMNIGFYCLAEN